MSAWQNSVHQWANATMNRQTALALTTCGTRFKGPPSKADLLLDSYVVDSDYFEFRFNGGEVISVVNPFEVAIIRDDLVVTRCELMRLEWYAYGEQPTPDSLCSVIYISSGGGVLREEYPPEVNERPSGDADVLVVSPRA